jgi:DNA-binding XRE family transcriptional regulator
MDPSETLNYDALTLEYIESLSLEHLGTLAPEVRKKLFGQWLALRFDEWTRKNKSHRGRKATPSESEMAEWIGITKTLFSQYKLGEKRPSLENADKIAAKLGTRVYDLLGLTRRMPNDAQTVRAMQEYHKMSKEGKNCVYQVILDRLAEEERNARVSRAKGSQAVDGAGA